MNNAVEIIDVGFACLVEKLGIVDAERFVALIKRDNFDYTIWRREYFDKMDLAQISAEAVSYAQKVLVNKCVGLGFCPLYGTR